jgi:hypothetical protein
MAYELFTRVALQEDFPQYRLRKGDIAVVVERHEGSDELETGYSLEVFNALGETMAILVVSESQIEPLMENEILHVRQLKPVGA